MKYTDTEIIHLIKQSSVQPADLSPNNIILRKEATKPVLFSAFEGKEALAYKEKQLNCFVSSRKSAGRNDDKGGYRSEKSYMWDVDVGNLSGVFDSQGQFIATTESDSGIGKEEDECVDNNNKKVQGDILNHDNFEDNNFIDEVYWIIKSGYDSTITEGPFTTDEIKKLDLTGKFIKRTVDKKFVEIDKVEVSGDFYETFDAERITEEIKNRENVVNKEQSINPIGPSDTEISKKNDHLIQYDDENWFLNCTKTSKLLKRRKCDMDLQTIEKEIRGLTKKDAKIKLAKITNLSEIDALDVLNLLVVEAKKEILSDVDRDGFMKIANK